MNFDPESTAGAGIAAADSELDALENAVPKSPRSRHVWVGLLVIIGAVSVLTALFTLTDAGMFRGRYKVTTVVENASGIRNGDPVQMRGVNIGRVYGFEMADDGVAIELEIEGDYPIPAGSHVVLRSGGLLGGTIAQVVPGAGSGGTVEEDDVLPGSRAPGPMDAVGTLGQRAEGVIGRVDTLLAEPTVASLRESAIALRDLIGSMSTLIEQERRDLDALGTSLRASVDGIERATSGPELSRTIAQIDTASARAARVAGTLERTSSSLDTILARIERGEGTLGRLSKDDELYVNLNRTIQTAMVLLEDFRENPGRYIRLEIF